jgi:hypothetical protein
MNVTDYTYLINKPNASTELQRLALEGIGWVFSERKSFTIKGLYTRIVLIIIPLKVTATYTTEWCCLISLLEGLMLFKRFVRKKHLNS